MRLWPGSPFPLGATYDGTGTNFAVFSEVADAVELCLFDAGGAETRVALPECTAQVWHGYAPTVGPGQRYGFRVHGPYEPAAGLRCHPSKLLLDPYATAVEGEVEWGEAMFTYRFDAPDGPLNDLDSGPFMPKGVVVTHDAGVADQLPRQIRMLDGQAVSDTACDRNAPAAPEHVAKEARTS